MVLMLREEARGFLMGGLLTAIVVRMKRSVFVMFTGWAIARED